MHPTVVMDMVVVMLQVNLYENSGPILNTALETIHTVWGHGRLCFSYRAPHCSKDGQNGV